MKKNNKKGFTLIELLIVVAIIGLLATLAIVSLNRANKKANDTKSLADIKSIQNAVEMYYNDNAAYPTPGSWAAFDTALEDQFDAAIPVPSNDTVNYQYEYASNGTEYCLKAGLQLSNIALEQDNNTADCDIDATSIVRVGSNTNPTTAISCDDGTATPFLYCVGN